MELIRNTLKSSLQRLNYFECRRGQLHEGEKLNYICMDRYCSKIGLFCSVCKSDHEDHNEEVMPLKIWLDKVRQLRKNRNPKSCIYETVEDHMQNLQNTKKMILYELKTAVQKLAQSFMKLEQKILKTYESAKTKLLEQTAMQFNLQIIIDPSLSNQISKQEEFEENIKLIAKMVQSTNKDEFAISNNSKNILKDFQNYHSLTIQKLCEILSHTQNTLAKQSEISEEKIKKNHKTSAKIKQHNSSKLDSIFGGLFNEEDSDISDEIDLESKNKNKTKYTFSTLLKGNSILIQKNGQVAKQTKTGSTTRFAMINEGVGQKQQKISFRITKLINWVGIGICIKQVITKANYGFKYEAIGHGSYLLSSNGYTWSHSSADDNIKNKTFLISQGQIIDVFLTQKWLKFVKRNNKQQLKLQISIKPYEWTSVCFCANLCSAQDKVQIVQE